MPCFLVPIHEFNQCHEPVGTAVGGRFCSTRGATSHLVRPGESYDLPATLTNSRLFLFNPATGELAIGDADQKDKSHAEVLATAQGRVNPVDYDRFRIHGYFTVRGDQPSVDVLRIVASPDTADQDAHAARVDQIDALDEMIPRLAAHGLGPTTPIQVAGWAGRGLRGTTLGTAFPEVFRKRRRTRESNDCHAPGGTPEGGQFCSTRGSLPGLRNYPRPEGSADIPDFLKQDVLNAVRAGIVVRHHQQPEPVMDLAGEIHDPLGLSHAHRGEETFFTGRGSYTPLKGPRGRIRIVTRGGEFEPTYETWGSYGPTGRKAKDLTPEMLPAELRATVHDVQSTFRHEVGHIMDDKTWPTKGAKYDIDLAREVRAWTYAVEISPDHTVSERMVRNGLMSHAYRSFRHAQILTGDEPAYAYVKRQNWLDQQETLDRITKNEAKTGVVNIEAHRKAVAFANRVLKALGNYGKVLRKKGIVRVPQAKDPWFPNAEERRLMQPGPGQHAWPGLL
jgi:hypothetical protein